MTSGIRLIITPDAEIDVRDILRYTLETWGRERRNAYYSELKRSARRLQVYPEIGRVVEGSIREFPVAQHVLLYRYEGDTVTILRAIHPRRLRNR